MHAKIHIQCLIEVSQKNDEHGLEDTFQRHLTFNNFNNLRGKFVNAFF